MLLAGFDGDDLLEHNDFGGRFILPAFFVGQQQIVGEHHPPSKDRAIITGASF